LGIPAIQKARIGAYIFKRRLRGQERYPLTFMLEPLFRCNLRCQGCGKIDYPAEILNKVMSSKECLEAAEECGAPIVCIAGGEPLLHPDIPEIVQGLTAQRKFVYLCTNGLLVKNRLEEFTPSNYLTFNVHIDGLDERHDDRVCLTGTFRKAVDAIGLLLSRGFRVTTNTTLFRGETAEGAARLFDFLTSLKVESMTVSSAFKYEKAADQESYFRRGESIDLFRSIFQLGENSHWNFNHSSLFLDFLAGNQDYKCVPWGIPTRNIFGWQKPCYLLNDEYEPTFEKLMNNTDWSRYGVGKDPRCTNCMLHCGFEATAVLDTVKHPFKALKVSLRGVNGRKDQ